MSKPKVLVTVPNIDGWIHKVLVFRLFAILQDSRIESNLIMPTHKPYANNWHHAIKDFLDQGYDYLISIDDDNPPKNNPIDLIFYDLDVIGCPTMVWANMKKGDQPFYYNIMEKYIDPETKEDGYRPKKIKEGEELVECDAVGSGCIVIARRVLEKLRYDQPFQREWDKDGFVIRGGDFSFCKKVKKAGFRIYGHFGYTCMHFNEIELTEIVSAVMNMKISGGK